MDNDPTDQIIIEQIQTLCVCNMPSGMPDHITIQKLITEKRTLTNARNRLNYKLRSLEHRNHQIKPASQLRPKGRKLKFISDQDIQSYLSTQVKPSKAITSLDEPLILVSDVKATSEIET